MQLISKISILTITVVFLFSPFLLSGKTEQENPLTKAIQLFDKKKFIDAETAFKKLLDEKPDDFMINYFYGACRTENGHYSEKDLQYLIKASKEVYPIDIDYYFGVQYHAKSEWLKALSYYNNYLKVATPEDQNRVELALRIEQCKNELNPFKPEIDLIKTDSVFTGVAASDSLSTGTVLSAEVLSTENEATGTKEILPSALTSTIVISDSVTTISDVDSLHYENITPDSSKVSSEMTDETVVSLEPVINFNINNEITYLFTSNFKTNEGKLYFEEANKKQTELDKMNVRTEILRTQYSKSKTKAEKDSLGQLIVQIENESYNLGSQVKKLFQQAKIAENNYWQNSSETEKENFINKLNQDSEAIAKENAKEKVTPVTDILLSPLLVENAPIEKPVKESKSSGVNYKIQLGAFSKGIPNSKKPVFKKIMMIRKVETYTDEKGVVVYTTGNLTRYEDADVMLNQVKQEGVKDAVIAAYLNGKRITLEQAKETEKKK